MSNEPAPYSDPDCAVNTIRSLSSDYVANLLSILPNMQPPAALTVDSIIHRCSDPIPGENLQHALWAEMIRRQHIVLKSSFNLEDSARLLSCATTNSCSAFIVLPHPHRRTVLDPTSWRYAIALRLGLGIFTGTNKCPVCLRRSPRPAPDLDSIGRHALLCLFEDGITRRHNGIRDFLCYRILKPLGLLVHREHELPRLSQGPSDLPAPLRLDLFLPPAASLIDVAQGIDVTIAHPQTAAHVADASRSGGAVATHREDGKHQHYDRICRANNIKLNPIGIDVYGSFGRDATEFFKRLSIFASQRHGSLPHEEEYRLYQKVTVALHRLQGRMLSARHVV